MPTIRLAVASASAIVKAEATARRTGQGGDILDWESQKRDDDRPAALWDLIPLMRMGVVARKNGPADKCPKATQQLG